MASRNTGFYCPSELGKLSVQETYDAASRQPFRRSYKDGEGDLRSAKRLEDEASVLVRAALVIMRVKVVLRPRTG